MVFCGDIALPFNQAVDIGLIPHDLASKCWVGNLEGSVITAPEYDVNALLRRRVVFNDASAISALKEIVNLQALNLANNHILNVCSIAETKTELSKLETAYVGGGDANDAQRELLLSDETGEYVLMSFGWDAIDCIYATKEREGVNPYIRRHVLDCAKRLTEKYPSHRIVFLFHWNYELELYPQPLDRELAHELIDMGIYAVIGCHAHRVQPVEVYKGHSIVYGMGNFAFRQGAYMDGRLQFLDFSQDEIVVELKHEGFAIHQFRYDKSNHTLTYVGEQHHQGVLDGMISADYNTFFKKNRYQKKALPIFYADDSALWYSMKVLWIRIRMNLIYFLLMNKKVFAFVKSLLH